jgi:hypothetical protein
MPPVVGDLATPLCDALASILHGNAALRTLIGRDPTVVTDPPTPAFVVPFEDTGEDTPLPIFCYIYNGDVERGGVEGDREATIELIAIAEQNDAREIANQMVAHARETLSLGTLPWKPHGLEAYVFSMSQDGGPASDREEVRGVYAMRLVLVIHATAP